LKPTIPNDPLLLYIANEDDFAEKEETSMVDDLLEIQERMVQRKREVEESCGFSLDKL
jgi:hypothetical protein